MKSRALFAGAGELPQRWSVSDGKAQSRALDVRWGGVKLFRNQKALKLTNLDINFAKFSQD